MLPTDDREASGDDAQLAVGTMINMKMRRSCESSETLQHLLVALQILERQASDLAMADRYRRAADDLRDGKKGPMVKMTDGRTLTILSMLRIEQESWVEPVRLAGLFLRCLIWFTA